MSFLAESAEFNLVSTLGCQWLSESARAHAAGLGRLLSLLGWGSTLSWSCLLLHGGVLLNDLADNVFLSKGQPALSICIRLCELLECGLVSRKQLVEDLHGLVPRLRAQVRPLHRSEKEGEDGAQQGHTLLQLCLQLIELEGQCEEQQNRSLIRLRFLELGEGSSETGSDKGLAEGARQRIPRHERCQDLQSRGQAVIEDSSWPCSQSESSLLLGGLILS
mmetsp:Transcript_15991/g.18995  ORF Transcript_15991/g.18995 Transcript_15991/m.18995 type:complete len:220 (-) Transcript_15991:304-963(-)